MEIDGLILSPQFDLSKFKPGTAIKVESAGAKDPFYKFDNTCLVAKALPLTLTVVYINTRHKNPFDDEDDDMDYSDYTSIDIPIYLVAEGKLKITFLGGK